MFGFRRDDVRSEYYNDQKNVFDLILQLYDWCIENDSWPVISESKCRYKGCVDVERKLNEAWTSGRPVTQAELSFLLSLLERYNAKENKLNA